MKKHRQFFLVFAALLSFTFASQSAWAKTYRITIGSGYNLDLYEIHSMWKNDILVNIQKRVKTETGHEIEFVGAWAGAIAKVGEELEAVESGILKMGLVITPAESSKLFLNNFGYKIPFGSRDSEAGSWVNLTMYRKNKILQDIFKRYNQKWLAVISYEAYDVITTFPFKTMADLKSKKIGALGANIPWLKNTGAVAVQSNTAEAYMSLQTGVIDGFMLPLSYAYGPKLYEVAKYATSVGISVPAGPCWTINLDLWNSMPPKVQEIFVEEADRYNEAVPALVAKLKREGDGKLQEKGVTFFSLSDEERGKWLMLVKDMAKDFVREANERGLPGKQLAQSYIEESERSGYTWPIKYELD
ncbi:TRAP transporter substrate-binding protein DctP [bacterium]|nr:TRAP transporter substrate-binding protein DctP [bacterium]